MLKISIWWSVFSFVFFKISIDALDESFRSTASLSVLGALLLGGIVGLSVYWGSYFYASEMGKHLARIRFKQESDCYATVSTIWCILSIINIVIGKMLVFGFSKDYNKTLGNTVFFRLSSYDNKDTIFFVLIVIIPITVHFLTVLHSIHIEENRVKSLD